MELQTYRAKSKGMTNGTGKKMGRVSPVYVLRYLMRREKETDNNNIKCTLLEGLIMEWLLSCVR